MNKKYITNKIAFINKNLDPLPDLAERVNEII